MNLQQLIDRGALFCINHSGGKDSQAMFAYLHRLIPADQIVVIHAHLPGVEWDGVEDHIKATIGGTPYYSCQARRTLIEMILERGMFPSPKNRQCTSDLKRGPIERTIRGIGHKLIVNCMGMRAEESHSRAKLQKFKLNERNSKAGREWYDWLPIHDWEINQVLTEIAAAGQMLHWAYYAGMTRLSCCFCIMASKKDLTTAARINLELYKQYVQLEKSTGQVMIMPGKKHGRKTLEQITGVWIEECND